MKFTQALILTAGMIAAFDLLQPARAVPEYLGILLDQFGLQHDQTAITAQCTYCHVNSDGSVPWNAFGDRVHVALFEPESRYNLALSLYRVLEQDKDSDGDGYTDVLEVVAKTLPGDAASKPKPSVAELSARLEKLGGVKIFKPK